MAALRVKSPTLSPLSGRSLIKSASRAASVVPSAGNLVSKVRVAVEEAERGFREQMTRAVAQLGREAWHFYFGSRCSFVSTWLLSPHSLF